MIFKIARCQECGHKRRDIMGKAGTVGGWPCDKCGGSVEYIRPRSGGEANWYTRVHGSDMAVGPDARVAMAIAGKMIRDELEGKHDIVKVMSMTFGEARVGFLAAVERTVKPATLKFYQCCLTTLQTHLGNPVLRTLRLSMVDRYVAKRLEQVSPTTVNREITTLIRFLNWGVKHRYLAANPIPGFPKFHETPRDRFYTEAEAEALVAACRGNLRDIVILALDTGLRKVDILSLRWSEVDLAGGFIRKRSCAKQRHPHPVTVPMTSRVSMTLTERVQRGPWVFPSYSDSGHINPASDLGFPAALKRAGIEEGNFHDLRRTFATLFAERGGDMKTLQEILDHSDINMTAKVYTKVSEQRKRQQMEVYENEA